MTKTIHMTPIWIKNKWQSFGKFAQYTIVGVPSSLIAAAIWTYLSGLEIKQLLSFLYQWLKLPTPLWVSILMGFGIALAICICFRIKNSNSSLKINENIKLIPFGNYKWRAHILNHELIKLERCPYCRIHSLRFICGEDRMYCPGTEKEICENELKNCDIDNIFASASSNLEKTIRDKDYQSKI